MLRMVAPSGSPRDYAGATDEEIVLACRRGDEAAWAVLIARYQRLVYSVARRAGLDPDLSADVFQHVFATLFENLHRIEEPSRVGAWMVTVARREALRLLRRQHGARSFVTDADEDTAGDVPDEGPLPQEALLRLEQQHAVRAALDGLDDRCRRLLTLLFYRPDPPPYAEVAAALGAPEGSIGPTRARCLRKLRRVLEQSGE